MTTVPRDLADPKLVALVTAYYTNSATVSGANVALLVDPQPGRREDLAACVDAMNAAWYALVEFVGG